MAAMTAAQTTTFKNAILADTNLASARANGDHGAIATYYNGAGANQVWRPDVKAPELNTAVVWSEFVALTALKQNGYIAMVMAGTLDATSASIRTGFTTIFGAGTSSLTNLTALAKRTSTKFGDLFVSGLVVPSTLYGYQVSASDVVAALGS